MVTAIPNNDPVLRAGLSTYRTASLFSQYPDTPHLLVVPFNVRTRSVREYGRGWLPVTFDHISINGGGGAREYYSSVSDIGAEDHIAAPVLNSWIPQLLPAWYNYRSSGTVQERNHAGLTGNLAILLALAVFSAPAAHLAEAMSSLRPGAWRPHRHMYPSGRQSYCPFSAYSSNRWHLDTIGERGVVVTILYDPINPQHSTRARLDQLQNGGFGPFYGRHQIMSPAAGTSMGVSSGLSGPSIMANTGSSAGGYRLP